MSYPNSTRTAFAKTVHSVTHRRTSKHSTSEFNFDAPGLDGTLFVNCSKECKAKGLLISKGLFGFFNSPKKRTKNICPSRLGQKLTFSSSFFGRIEDTKISFQD